MSFADRRAPATVVLAGVAVGAALAAAVTAGLQSSAVLVVLALAVRRHRRLGLLVLGVAVGLTVGSARAELAQTQPIAAAAGHALRATATLETSWRTTVHGAYAEATVPTPRGRVLMRTDGPGVGDRGDIVRVVGVVRAPRSGGSFDEAGWLARRRVAAVVHVAELEVTGHRGGPAGAADRLRAAAIAQVRSDREAERLVVAIALGADDELDARTRDDFRHAGLTHLLAVSGQNVALLVAGVVSSVLALGGTRSAGHIGAIGAVVAYVAIVGPSPSVARAAIAGILVSVAWLASRPADAWHLLVAAAAALLAWNPLTVGDPGFQLSFAAVAAIFVLGRPLERELGGYPIPGVLRGSLALACACTLATAPILVWHFGTTGLVAAVPANVLAAPAAAPILGSGLVATAAAPVAPPVSRLALRAGALPAGYVLAVARTAAAIDRRWAGG